MTSRENYLENIKQGNLPVDYIYEYYKLHNNKAEFNFDISTFTQLFQIWVNLFKPDLTKVKSYFDNFYQIMNVYNKENQLITML